jgi:hypothetical protein
VGPAGPIDFVFLARCESATIVGVRLAGTHLEIDRTTLTMQVEQADEKNGVMKPIEDLKLS